MCSQVSASGQGFAEKPQVMRDFSRNNPSRGTDSECHCSPRLAARRGTGSCGGRRAVRLPPRSSSPPLPRLPVTWHPNSAWPPASPRQPRACASPARSPSSGVVTTGHVGAFPHVQTAAAMPGSALRARECEHGGTMRGLDASAGTPPQSSVGRRVRPGQAAS